MKVMKSLRAYLIAVAVYGFATCGLESQLPYSVAYAVGRILESEVSEDIGCRRGETTPRFGSIDDTQ